MRREPCAVAAAAGAALTLVALTFDAAPLFVPGVGADRAVGVLTPVWVGLARRGAARCGGCSPPPGGRGQPGARDDRAATRGRSGRRRSRCTIRSAAEATGGAAPLWPTGRGRSATISVVARSPAAAGTSLPPPVAGPPRPAGPGRIWRAARGQPDEVLVLPRTERVLWRGRDLGGDRGGERRGGRGEPLAAVELDGLRPYRVGTPASRIHWAALARGAGLLERRLRADADTRPLVVLDTRCSSPDSPALDAAVRAAASLTFHLARRGGCGLLMPVTAARIEIDPDLACLAGRPRPARRCRGRVRRARPPASPRARGCGRIFYVAAEPRPAPAGPRARRAAGRPRWCSRTGWRPRRGARPSSRWRVAGATCSARAAPGARRAA